MLLELWPGVSLAATIFDGFITDHERQIRAIFEVENFLVRLAIVGTDYFTATEAGDAGAIWIV